MFTALLLLSLAGPSLTERVGASVPQGLMLIDDRGESKTLGERLSGETPTVLVPASYGCTMLCGLVMQGVIDALSRSGVKPDDVRLLTVSFDHRDYRGSAERKWKSLAAEHPEWAARWRFAVADESGREALQAAIGMGVEWDAPTKQYAHPAATVVLTARGTISRYLYGVSYGSRDFRLALQEAREGRGGPAFDRVMLTCFRYDPATRRYGPWIRSALRSSAALVAMSLLGMVVVLRRRERRGGAR